MLVMRAINENYFVSQLFNIDVTEENSLDHYFIIQPPPHVLAKEYGKNSKFTPVVAYNSLPKLLENTTFNL